MKSNLIVVAKRWDGIGARLHALLNAWSVARALGLEPRFVWPLDAEDKHYEPRELFNDAFLQRFEITESICPSRVVQPDLTGLSLHAAKELCRAEHPRSMIEITECFDVLGFANEPAEAAQARFCRGLREISWSRACHATIEYVSDEKYSREYSAIHVRAGNIVTGNSQQFLPVEKYTPMAFVEFAIETLSGVDRSSVVVVSDNNEYVRQLKARFNMIRTPSDIIAGYAELTEWQRAFADILVLSQAQRIVGPPGSAFSRLAANLGSLSTLSFEELMMEDDARRCLRDGIARAGKNAERLEVLRPQLARDICWFLDVFSDNVTLGDKIVLARQATLLAPDFCGALNRSAAELALAGNRRASKKAALRAQSAAAIEIWHADPLVESLATSISAKALALALGAQRHGRRRLLEWLGLASIVRRFGNGGDRTAILDDIKQSLKRCETLTPFHIHHHDVLINLRFQIAMLAWLTAADDRFREIAKATIKPADREPLFLPSWRPSGFSKLRASHAFPQVLRNVEVLTIRIARGIGTAVSSAPLRPLTLGHVDNITTSPSGLQWINGWAYDADVGRNELAVGYLCNDGVVSGGLTFLARPDVAAALNDPRALNCAQAVGRQARRRPQRTSVPLSKAMSLGKMGGGPLYKGPRFLTPHRVNHPGDVRFGSEADPLVLCNAAYSAASVAAARRVFHLRSSTWRRYCPV